MGIGSRGWALSNFPALYSEVYWRSFPHMFPGRASWVRILSAGMALALIALGSPAWAQSNPPKGVILIAIKGQVKVKRARESIYQVAVTNMVLELGDSLNTSDFSEATVKLADESIGRVDELTDIIITAPGPKGGPYEVFLKEGGFYLLNREKKANTRFRTPVGSGAILGTEFALRVEPGTGLTRVSLLEGRIELDNSQGPPVSLEPNEQALLQAGAAPVKSPLLDVVAPIQWALYYPAVIDPAALREINASLQPALAAYARGNLLAAIALGTVQAASVATPDEALLLAQLAIAAGQAERAQSFLATAGTTRAEPLVRLLAVVRGQTLPAHEPANASDAVTESYAAQSSQDLARALRLARRAVEQSPDFGAAHARVAELEFAHGHSGPAREALARALRLSPDNAHALTLNGFVLAARSQVRAAQQAFETALAADPHLGNAWLGRGLTRIKLGDAAGGRTDLQIAAALEPTRAIHRSYLGKAYAGENDLVRARRELERARALDPQDPTSWLYGALLSQQENRVNAAISDLEHAQSLNQNRAIFRSRQLLDQDRAVQGANLASVYRDAGLVDLSARTASQAVGMDYANASAHLFLANSYDALRDPREFNLRYETPWFSELLLANLLAPVGAGSLSQNVSLQEYSPLLERDRIGITSFTQWYSGGDWVERGSVYGTFGGTSFALDTDLRSETGFFPNTDSWRLDLYGKFKQQIGPQDTAFLQIVRSEREAGDLRSVYASTNLSRTQELLEKQEPNVFAGWHHQWQPGQDTLLLGGLLRDDLSARSGTGYGRRFTGPTNAFDYAAIPWIRYGRNTDALPNLVSVDNPGQFDQRYATDFQAWSVELQHIATMELGRLGRHTVIAGGRYQAGDGDAATQLSVRPGDNPLGRSVLLVGPGGQVERFLLTPPTNQFVSYELGRAAAYLYDVWQPLPQLELTGGITYDWVDYPLNITAPPIIETQQERSRLSPKVGLRWTPTPRTQWRAAWTRSLGGVFYDNSVRLEPVQVAGFTQAYRSLIPESLVGNVPGTTFQTVSGGIDHQFPTRTYLGASAEWLTSDADQVVGAYRFDVNGSRFTRPISVARSLPYDETSLSVYLNQLLGDDWVLGAAYRVSEANLQINYEAPYDGTLTPGGRASPNRDATSTLHQASSFVQYTHACGAFLRFNTRWVQQSNRGDDASLPGDDFWQHDVLIGYRFWQRRAEVRVGVLNLADADYQLSPLNLRDELPRERTYYMSLRLQF